MPIFVLWAHTEMEGVASLSVPETSTWTFNVQRSAGSEVREGVVIDPEEEFDVPNTKNTTANFMLKFEGDTKFSYLKVLSPGQEGWPKKGLTLKALTPEDGEALVPIFACECRGMEPVGWTPIGPYVAVAESGNMFDEVGFREGDDWCDYDEKGEASMSVSKDFRYEFRLHK